MRWRAYAVLLRALSARQGEIERCSCGERARLHVHFLEASAGLGQVNLDIECFAAEGAHDGEPWPAVGVRLKSPAGLKRGQAFALAWAEVSAVRALWTERKA